MPRYFFIARRTATETYDPDGTVLSDNAAALAHAEVHPASAARQAILAARDRLGEHRDLDLVEVRADWRGH